MSDRYRYLLDTNIISALMRQPQGRIAQRIIDVGAATVCTSIIVAAELRYGVEKSGSQRLQARLDDILPLIPVLPLSRPADFRYARLRNALREAGQPIGPNDMLIAADALARDLTVVTANEQEFRRVPGLRVSNWLKPG